MPWDWTTVIEQIPEKKRQYYEILHHQAELLADLPKTKADAIPITEDTLEAIFLKVFEANQEFDYTYLEKRMRLLKAKWKRLCSNQGAFLVYYPTTILRIVQDNTQRQLVIQMRIHYGASVINDRYAHWLT